MNRLVLNYGTWQDLGDDLLIMASNRFTLTPLTPHAAHVQAAAWLVQFPLSAPLMKYLEVKMFDMLIEDPTPSLADLLNRPYAEQFRRLGVEGVIAERYQRQYQRLERFMTRLTMPERPAMLALPARIDMENSGD